jgi:transcriptional regulator with GAF, ATPase, and Fis domain
MKSDERTNKSADASLAFADSDRAHSLIGPSRLFQQVLAVIDAVAGNDCVVLLEGETGTGKELLARRIHEHSPRRDEVFIPLNCAGVSETLFESQLFGHVKGAFTGAASETLGVVRAADKGTLLLDEIGEIPFQLQAKLLRLLQEREVTPVGSAIPVHVNVRFVASTNRSLQKMVQRGEFRADLYHRLNIVRIEVPPLRTRLDDIDALVEYYLEQFAHEYRRPARQLGRVTRQQLRDYAWPGNVRELCGYIERLYAIDMVPMTPGGTAWDDGYVSHSQPQEMVEAAPGRIKLINDAWPFSLAEVERQAIQRALNHAGWNRSAAAKLLDLHRSTLIRTMRSCGVNEVDGPRQR